MGGGLLELQMLLLAVVLAVTILFASGSHSIEMKKRCVLIVTIILALFSGLRSWWMGDLIKYYTLFRTVNGEGGMELVRLLEPNWGIRLFFRLAGTLGISYDTCIFLIAVFTAVSLGLLVFYYSPSPYWSYLIYIGMGFYLFTYSGLKQTIAMGFVIFAAMEIFAGRFWRFLIWTLLAGCFHAPALIFLLAYPICRQKMTSWYYVFIVLLLLLVLLFRAQIVELLSQLYYDEQETFEDTGEVGGRFIMMLLILGVGIVLRPLHSWDKLYSQVFSLLILAAAFQTMSIFDNIFTRLSDYYYQFVVLFFPLIMEPGDAQILRFYEHRREVRRWPAKVYLVVGLGISAFALWYYNHYIFSTREFVELFRFRWTIDPYSLYGA